MIKVSFLLAALLVIPAITPLLAQQSYKVRVLDGQSRQPLPGANVALMNTTRGAVADVNGVAEIRGLENGVHIVVISFVGYTTVLDTIRVPFLEKSPRVVHLHPTSHEVGEVTVTTTRSSRDIQDIPTRIEVIGADELDEKSSMRSSDIRMQLNESTGIIVQPTSAVSGNATFRIQGLDGRYTLLLKDGFPLYGGFSSGLSILQIPPLDLRQIEIVKGSSSTLHGGGAIAGLINLVTKRPGRDPEQSIMVNGTTAGGWDLSGFFSGRDDVFGWSAFAAGNSQRAYDANADRFSDIPQIERVSFNPKGYYDSGPLSVSFGINSTFERRFGGNIDAIRDESLRSASYVEEDYSDRLSSQLSLKYTDEEGGSLNGRNSISYFKRRSTISNSSFSGNQWSTFSELSWQVSGESGEWIIGGNLWTDDFRETSSGGHDVSARTFGLFAQHSGNLTESLLIEPGLRIDHDIEYGTFILPRASLLYKITPALTSRLGGGTGYKAPTIFTEESEQALFRNTRQLIPGLLKAERSYGLNWDLNYRAALWGEIALTFNCLVFYTKVSDPLIPDPDSLASSVVFNVNSGGFVDTRGFEVNLKFSYRNYTLFAGHTFTDPEMHESGRSARLPLAPFHKLNTVLLYEVDDDVRIGAELYYTGSQKLRTGGTGRGFLIVGLMIEKRWDPFSVFLNFENFTDTRLSRFGPIFTGPATSPTFVDLYAPLEGFVANTGFKVRL